MINDPESDGADGKHFVHSLNSWRNTVSKHTCNSMNRGVRYLDLRIHKIFEYPWPAQ
jgi:hypothetical protein